MSKEETIVNELLYDYLHKFKLEDAAEYLMRVTETESKGTVILYSSDDDFINDLMCCCATDICCESSCDCCNDCCCCDECGETSCGQ